MLSAVTAGLAGFIEWRSDMSLLLPIWIIGAPLVIAIADLVQLRRGRH